MEQPSFYQIDKLARGDEEVKNMLIDVIKEEFPLEKNEYFNSFNDNDYKKTKELVHKLKHKISILGLTKSYELASAYEHNLVNNSIEGFKDFEITLATITDFVDKL